MKPKAVIFDFDGTIFDLDVDWDNIKKTLTNNYKNLGYSFTFTPLYINIFQILEKIRRDFGEKRYLLEKQRIFSLIKKKEMGGINGGKIKPYATKLFRYLKDMKVAIGIVSDNSYEVINKVISIYKLSPSIIIGREAIQKMKPNPEGVLLFLRKLKLNPSEVYAIGNSLKDLQTFQRAKIKNIFILEDRNNPNYNKEFISNNIDYIKNLEELKSKI